MSGAIYIIFGTILIPLFVMALYLLNGKGASLIAGYNTMSKDEKAKYDEKALCRFVGRLLIVIILFMTLIPAGAYFENTLLGYCGVVSMFVVTICGVIYANTGYRFRRNVGLDSDVVNANENTKSTTKTVIITSVPLTAILLIAVSILFYQGEKDPIVNVLDNSIQIKAMYGLNVEFSEISDISLIERNMRDIGIGNRNNGYGGFGETLKGNFKSDRLGETLLFVQVKSSPTIQIERFDNKDVYLSFRNSETTKALYNDMMTAHFKDKQ